MGKTDEKKSPVKAGLKWGAIGTIAGWFLTRPQCIACDGSKFLGFITEEMFIKGLMAVTVGIIAFAIGFIGIVLRNIFGRKSK